MTEFKTLHKRRLLRLERFLRTLQKSQFYFGSFVHSFDEENHCGTVCCALGWCPVVFPHNWVWTNADHLHMPTLKLMQDKDPEYSIEQFFGIAPSEYAHLFFPDHQVVSIYGGKYLERDATPTDVADNIAAFIAYKEAAYV